MRSVHVARSIPRIALSRATRPWLPSVAYGRLGPVGDRAADDRDLPGPGWVLVRNLQSGICASDLAVLRAEVDPRVTIAALPGRDRTYLGHEVVGEVLAAGAGTGLEPGERVVLDTRFQGPTCRSTETGSLCRACAAGNPMLCENPDRFPAELGVGGGWSERILCHASEVYRVPPELDDDQAMLVEPFSLGMRAALKALPGPGERCLVVGGGMAGLSIVQTVRLLSPDAHITVVARHPAQAALAEGLGADRVERRLDPARLAEPSRMFRGPLGSYFVMGGFDVVFDCVGSGPTLTTSLRLARASATVVLVGIRFAPVKADLSPVWHQEVRLAGVLAHGWERAGEEDAHTYDLVCRHLVKGDLSTDGFITDRFPLAEWRRAVARADARADGVIRVVLDTTRG
ncbi:threonine dehydrogenase-like Zn-dependent dehydrogenase [Actinophytocola oryzae]|uniref:Threonine dehydrogenase-like Zn-dependent dehydrogenase n=2 Tax=Actinophytocola oryzae TaxID=502181 RepID=A0A4V3FUR1_9PSEU|nr:threonine dehydrogenase-like Zn-dependent dehydrogenase [Actinophytocola oryzae]